jgi:putative solute:sodium symporter small subunit
MNLKLNGPPVAYLAETIHASRSIVAFVILIFWFAGRQEKIDEEFGFTEREDVHKMAESNKAFAHFRW